MEKYETERARPMKMAFRPFVMPNDTLGSMEVTESSENVVMAGGFNCGEVNWETLEAEEFPWELD